MGEARFRGVQARRGKVFCTRTDRPSEKRTALTQIDLETSYGGGARDYTGYPLTAGTA
jgi:hypothetical protein